MAKLKTAKGSMRAKSGLAAKAGRRRPHNIVKNKHGDYEAAPYKARPSKRPEDTSHNFCMTHDVKPNDPRRVDYEAVGIAATRKAQNIKRQREIQESMWG